MKTNGFSKLAVMILLSLALILCFATGALAVADDETTPGTCKIIDTTYSFADALTAVSNAGTIILLSDITIDGNLNISNGKNFNINLNGNTLAIEGDFLLFDESVVRFIDSSVIAGELIVKGNVCSDTSGIWAECIAVKVFGSIKAGCDGISANDSTVTITGDIEAGYNGISAYNAAIKVNGNIKSGEKGVYADEGAVVIVEGNIEASEDGISATSNAEVTVIGNIKVYTGSICADDGASVKVFGDISGGGVAANAAAVSVTGNIESAGNGVMAKNSTIKINGNITADQEGIFVFHPGLLAVYGQSYIDGDVGSDTQVIVSGNVVAVSCGVYAVNDTVSAGLFSTVTVNNNIEIKVGGYIEAGNQGIYAVNCNMYANDGAKVIGESNLAIEVNGAISSNSNDGVFAINGFLNAHTNTTISIKKHMVIEVGGDIEASSRGIYTENGATVNANGSVTSFNNDGVRANNSIVTIAGTISSYLNGINAGGYANVTVNGSIKATSTGINAYDATINIIGDINAGGDGVFAWNSIITVNGAIKAEKNGVCANDDSQVTVTGVMCAGEYYLLFDWVPVAQTPLPATKTINGLDYYEYSGGDPLSYVWVKIPTAPVTIYNADDIAVINAIIKDNGLNWTPANPADGSAVPADWTGVTWSNDDMNKRITELYIPGENLTGTLNVSDLYSLEWLNCGNNKLSALDVSKNTSLITLECWGNQLTVLDVRNNANLLELSCGNNDLTALDIKNITDLRLLWCWGNQLTVLDVSNNTLLLWLDCSFNQLTTLNISENIELIVLECGFNLLTELDVKNNPELISLECNDNQLAALDVSKNTKLDIFNCSDNLLNRLNVTGLPLTTLLWCQHNYMNDISDVIGFTGTWDGEDFCFDPQFRRIYVTAGTGGTIFYKDEYYSWIEYYAYGSLTLTAVPENGYMFEGWYEGNTRVSTNSSYTFTVTVNRNLEARFIRSNGGETTDAITPIITTQPKDIAVNVGAEAQLSIAASVAKGTLSYQWYSNTNRTNSGGTLISDATGAVYKAPTNNEGTSYYYCLVTNTDNDATGNKTAFLASNVVQVTVKTTDPGGPVGGGGGGAPAATHTVTFNSNGGSAVASKSVASGSKVAKPADPAKEGFTFDAWYTDAALTTAYNFDKAVTADFTLYAKWTAVIIEDPETPLAGLISFAAFIQGFEDNTFRGDTPITREQFVAILYRLKNAPATPAADKSNPSFKDVAPQRWSYDAVEWALKADIIAADAEGNFRPAAPLTRAEMAVMLVKTDKLTEIAENTFSDLAEHPHRDDILKAAQAKIFTGYPDGSFKPEGHSTRNEAVTALIRYLLGGEPEDEMWQELSITFSDVPRDHWAYKYIVLAVNGK